MKKWKKGFTLIEIMSGVAIIGLLAALAIPSAVRTRVNANEAAAQATLRTLSTVMESYRFSNSAYPTDLSQLAFGSAGPAYVDEAVAGGSKAGYTFQVVSADRYTYHITATPQEPDVTGAREFILTESGIIEDVGPDVGTGTINKNPSLPISRF